MPMIPEAVIAMLGCARIGAIHSVVFGGFASNELASRIDDSKAKLLVTASCGFEPGRTVEYKPLVDEAIKIANHKISIPEKTCLCTHFRKFNIWTCGHYVYRLKDTTNKLDDGKYQLLSAEEVFLDYQFSKDHSIKLPEPKESIPSNVTLAAA